MTPTHTANPLLDLQGLPRFDAIEPAHVEPAIRTAIERLDTALTKLEAEVEPTWEGLVEPLEKITEELGRAWGIVGHLMGVKNSDELRKAHESVQGDVVKTFTRVRQSEPIYRAAVEMRDGPAWDTLDAAQQRIVTKMIQHAELAGIALEGDDRTRFNEIQQELAELSTKFSNAVLDATKAWDLTLEDPAEMDGCPASLRELAAESAKAAGQPEATPENGPWRITLDHPSFGPFMQHAKRRDLRERIYRAFISRAGEGEFDNRARIDRILELRQAQADLLGYPDYATMSLATKMAPDVDEVMKLLEELRVASYEHAKTDLAETAAYAKAHGQDEELAHWDVPFWTERVREQQFSFTDEQLRPYFPLPRVLEGLFALSERLFGVEIDAADGEVAVWHDDIRFFRIRDDAGNEIAAFFLDPYSRPAEKRGGAWMDECVGRSRLLVPDDHDLRLPVAYLICNGTPPVGSKPSLMSFREVETLFHEFGHGLQHMLTTIDYDSAAGINGVEWDAVELPSQFMENWCYHRPTLLGFSGHYETGEPLPEDLFEKIVAARTFRGGTAMLRQLYFAMTDLALHHGYDPQRDGSPEDVQRRIAAKTTLMTPLPEDRFLCSFSHIFAGGYAAGYYSYKWAEVLSADAFSAFEEAGLEDESAIRTTGQRFRDTVLGLGGSQHPLEVFTAFRGRGPETTALLRHTFPQDAKS
ncbi:MAG: M3 family metallopeptidase [Planctomycetes bacterium]|nr:M3 family metallopeptidase [Planctomycetota bacterium]